MHWAHSEQLLLACLADHDADVRGRAVARIIQLHRESEEPTRKQGRPTASGLRVFQLPKPNWVATLYSNMIDWKAEQVYEPPYASFLLIRLENSRNCRSYSMCLQTPNMSRGVSNNQRNACGIGCSARRTLPRHCVKPSASSKNGNKGRFHGLKNIRQRT